MSQQRYVHIITGSRHFDDEEAIRPHLPPGGPKHVVIHGAASGVDAIVDKLCRAQKNRVVPVPAMWDRENAGPERNAAMVEIALVLVRHGYEGRALAFPGPDSKGTWSCVQKLRKAGIVPTIVRVPK